MSSLADNILTAIFAVTAAAQLWQTWKRAEGEYAARRSGRYTNADGSSSRGGARQIVMTTPQGERIIVLASDEALREMGILQEDGEGAVTTGGGGGGGGGATLRIAGRRGEFGPDDYEELSRLDDQLRPAAAAPVSQELLDVLPTHEHRSRRKVSSSSSSSGAAATENENRSSSSSFETCSVCLQDFLDGENVRTLPCLHHFHLECVDPWLQQRGRNLAACPVCKTKVFA